MYDVMQVLYHVAAGWYRDIVAGLKGDNKATPSPSYSLLYDHEFYIKFTERFNSLKTVSDRLTIG